MEQRPVALAEVQIVHQGEDAAFGSGRLGSASLNGVRVCGGVSSAGTAGGPGGGGSVAVAPDCGAHLMVTITADHGHTLPVTLAEVTAAVVQAGALEMPNVSIVKGMTDLVSATRAFEALQRAVESFSQLEHRAANDIVGAR